MLDGCKYQTDFRNRKVFLNRKIFLSIFSFIFVILFINFISAVPPVTTTQQFTEGYTIEIPQDNILVTNQDYYFNFHVFNISNGVAIHDNIQCDFHLYDDKGVHKYEARDNVASLDYDYQFNVSATNFSNMNHYYYFIQCNSTNYGGYSSNILYINQYSWVSTLGFYCIFLTIIFLIFLIGFKLKNAWIMTLGSILVLILGFFIIINGIDVIKDTSTTWAIGIIVWALGIYFMYLSVEEQLKNWNGGK